MYMYVSAHVRIDTDGCEYIHIQMDMNIHIHIYVYIYIYICAILYIYIYIKLEYSSICLYFQIKLNQSVKFSVSLLACSTISEAQQELLQHCPDGHMHTKIMLDVHLLEMILSVFCPFWSILSLSYQKTSSIFISIFACHLYFLKNLVLVIVLTIDGVQAAMSMLLDVYANMPACM